MKTRVRFYGRAMYTAKRVRCTLIFEDGKLTNPRTLAFSSMVGWGKVQGSYKLKCQFGDCWWVSTPGHGGYILVSSTKLEWAKNPSITIEESYGKVYVYEFEEDSDWAVLEYHDLKLLADSQRKSGRSRTPEEHLRESVIPCLERWNDWVLGVSKPKDEHGFTVKAA